MLRRSAEQDASGDAANTNELKKVMGVTTNLTKVARGTEVKKDEEEETGNIAEVPESEEEDEDVANDEIGETDGVQKKNVNKYASDASDDDKDAAESDSEPSVAGESSQHDNDETAVAPEQK